MEELIRDNFWLIKSIGSKFYNVEWEDLYQAGCVGIIKAYNNYKDNNIKFSSYAYKYIFGEMYELSLKCRDIKLNKYYLKLYKLINQTRNTLALELGREVNLIDISNYLNIDISDIENVILLMEDMFSLDDEYANIQVSSRESLEDEILIRDSINSLDELEGKVFNYRYNLDLTQQEVANILGISQVKVSRLEKKSKNKILEYIK